MWYKPYNKDQLNAINIPEAPGNFHIKILYNEAGSHFDLIVPMNSHNILPPPHLPEKYTTYAIDLS